MRPHEVTQGTTDDALGTQAGLMPQDELHGVCAFCGLTGEYPEVIRTILPGNIPARRCSDRARCWRKRRRDRT